MHTPTLSSVELNLTQQLISTLEGIKCQGTSPSAWEQAKKSPCPAAQVGCAGGNQSSSKLPCKMETLVPSQARSAGRVPWLLDALPSPFLCSWQRCQAGAEPAAASRQVVPEPGLWARGGERGDSWDPPDHKWPAPVQGLGRWWWFLGMTGSSPPAFFWGSEFKGDKAY